MDKSVKVLSLNCRGLRDNNKRCQIFRWLKKIQNGSSSFVFLQETHSLKSDEKKWEKEWGSKVIFSHGSNNSQGVAILFPVNTTFEYSLNNTECDRNGRFIFVSLASEYGEFQLLNIYAPTQDKIDDQLLFFSNLKAFIETNPDLIIGGDFNTYLKPQLDKYNCDEAPSKTAVMINQLMETLDIIDVWRVLNPDRCSYTWRRRKPLIQSRLDYWLIPTEYLHKVKACDIKPSILTDHSLITIDIQLSFSECKRGPGFWKFNERLLYDEKYVLNLKDLLLNLKNEYAEENNKALKWELIKMEIRNMSISYSKKKSKQQKDHEIVLHNNYLRVSNAFDQTKDERLLDELNNIKNEIEQINAIKTKGAKLRSKITDIEDGDKPTKYFLNLEKKNYNIKHIKKLHLDSDVSINDPNKILKSLKDYYQNLYNMNDRNSTFDDFLFEDIPKLDIDSKESLEQPITLNELTAVIKKIKRRKSPGTDGLTSEFYIFFWNDIKDLVFECFVYSFENNILSIEQRRAILKLLPKKDKNLLFIKNWRPISLLNTDYKILAHLLANRLQKILQQIISIDQNGYLKGRFIGYNIRAILDAIEDSNTNNKPLLLAFLDFEKAFDSLNWNFLFKTLSEFGFGPQFSRWIQLMYKDISSCVMNNGYTSEYFNLKCGVRQGCPLSALLFIITVEVLAINIRNNKHIDGVTLGDGEIKITQLADDTTLILRNICSLQTSMNIIYMFYSASGLKLNSSKTEILYIGRHDFEKLQPFNLKWVKDKVYSLGTWFYKDIDKTIEYNWEHKTKIFQNTLDQWKNKHMSYFGKITVIKTLALSKIQYLLSSFFVPAWVTEFLKKSVRDFMWNGKPSRIKHNTIIMQYEDGGIKFPDIHEFFVAQKAAWAKRLLEMPNSLLKTIIRKTLGNINMTDLLNSSIDCTQMTNDIPLFYKQVLVSIFELRKYPQNIEDVKEEVIWLNKHIKINNASLWYEQWYLKGMVCIEDIMNNNRFLTFNEVKEKFSLCNKQAFKYMSIIDAIPREWKLILKSLDQQQILQRSQNKDITKFKSKEIYWNCIKKTTPTCKMSWNKMDISLTDSEWKYIYTLIHKLTQNCKLKEFQYKIVNNVYASNSVVAKFDKSIDPKCNLCNKTNNTYHFFYECKKAKQFWTEFQNWIGRVFHPFEIVDKNILFGIIDDKMYLCNFFILHAKWFLHTEHKNSKSEIQYKPKFIQFLMCIKHILNVEKQLYIKKNKLSEYNELFACVEQIEN